MNESFLKFKEYLVYNGLLDDESKLIYYKNAVYFYYGILMFTFYENLIDSFNNCLNNADKFHNEYSKEEYFYIEEIKNKIKLGNLKKSLESKIETVDIKNNKKIKL